MSFQLLLADRWTWNIPLLVAVLLLALLYAIYVTRVLNSSLISIRPLLFISGMGLFYALTGTPLNPISQLSFSLHMIQMSLLYFIVPPLFLIGIQSPYSCKSSRLSMLSLSAFACLFFLYHLPLVLQLFAQHATYQALYSKLLLCFAFGMWLPLTLPNQSNQKKFIFLSSILITPACLLFIFSAFSSTDSNPFIAQLTAHLCLPSGNSGLLPPPFNTGYDQVIAGGLMIFIHKISITICLKLAAKLKSNKIPKPIQRAGLSSTFCSTKKTVSIHHKPHSKGPV